MWPFKRRCARPAGIVDSDDRDLQLNVSWNDGPLLSGFKLIAYLGGHQVGAAHGTYCAGHQFRLTKIEVPDTHKGKGFGTIMIGTLIGAAHTHKCRHFVFEGVSNTNLRAIRLYLRFGAKEANKLDQHKTDYVISLFNSDEPEA